MEGKGILFKAFADIDVFDLEVGSEDPEDVIRFCQLLEPTLGGINLEDIRSPDCFYIEETLRETLSIPVFHDDQHGTAIISGAALLNALELVDKDAGAVKVVFAGAGAAAIATAEHYVRLGVQRERIVMCDHKGVISSDRTDLDRYKSRFARKTQARTLAEALRDADVFVGLSVAGIVSGDMLKGMAPRPIVFALANPTPEIMPEEARQARPDAIIATGRSDFPNQVNNVLGFPFIFRGALDVRAKKINGEMEMAATRARAALAKEEVADDAAVTLEDIALANPRTSAHLDGFARELWERRRRKGITLREARARVLDPLYHALLMLQAGQADAVVAGVEMYYSDAIRPALEVIGAQQGRRHVSGIYMLVFPQQTLFFADCTVNIDPTADTLAEIASATAEFVGRLGIEPRVALLSFSNFGSVRHPAAEKVQQAVSLLYERAPGLQADGEMQADTAVVERILNKTYPFSRLRGAANVLIFPNLDAANIAYKLLDRLGGAQAIGPILVGMAQPVHVLQRGSEVNDIVNMAVIAAVDALEHGRRPPA